MGISGDPPAKQKKFVEKFGFPYPMLCDVEHEALTAYGVWGPKKMLGREYAGIYRTTYLVDEAGVIFKVYPKVKPPGHAVAILKDWGVTA